MCPAFIDLAIHGESPDPVLSVPVPAGIHLPLYFFFSIHLSCVYLSSGPPETPGACVATCKSRRQLLQLRVSAIWCRVLLGFVPEGAEIHQQRLIDVNKLSALMLRPLICVYTLEAIILINKQTADSRCPVLTSCVISTGFI